MSTTFRQMLKASWGEPGQDYMHNFIDETDNMQNIAGSSMVSILVKVEKYAKALK